MENREGKEGEIVKGGGKLKMEGWKVERYENEQRTFFFFYLSLFEPLIFVWCLPKWKFLGEIF